MNHALLLDQLRLTASPALKKTLGVVALSAFVALCGRQRAHAALVVFESAGSDPASVTATRDAFRSAVGGGTVAGANGDFGGLRREINWDGVPAGFSDPNLMPGNFFNANSPRGAVFTTPGDGFLVSANAGGDTPVLFGFPGDLQAFSPQKLFASVGSNVMDISFFVAGTDIAATTTAFGAIFVDTETNDANGDFTRMEFFNAQGSLIFSRNVLPAGNQGLSFLGGVADAGERISRVRITTPANFLLSNGVRANEDHDFVVLDDMLYATPTVVSANVAEPGVLALMMVALVAGAGGLRRSRKA